MRQSGRDAQLSSIYGRMCLVQCYLDLYPHSQTRGKPSLSEAGPEPGSGEGMRTETFAELKDKEPVASNCLRNGLCGDFVAFRSWVSHIQVGQAKVVN